LGKRQNKDQKHRDCNCQKGLSSPFRDNPLNWDLKALRVGLCSLRLRAGGQSRSTLRYTEQWAGPAKQDSLSRGTNFADTPRGGTSCTTSGCKPFNGRESRALALHGLAPYLIRSGRNPQSDRSSHSAAFQNGVSTCAGQC